MKYEEIVDNQIQELVWKFYIYQGALIRTPLGLVGVGQQPEYPVYFRKYQNELDGISTQLESKGIVVEKAMLPEEPSPSDPMGFLQRFEHQGALKYILVLDREVIQPPRDFSNALRVFIEGLPVPWQ